MECYTDHFASTDLGEAVVVTQQVIFGNELVPLLFQNSQSFIHIAHMHGHCPSSVTAVVEWIGVVHV